MDACTTAFMGILMAYAGDWEHGCALAERAMQLNPHHPGWYRFSSFQKAYQGRDYRAALDVALKFNMPSYFHTHAALAAAYGQLGEREAAQGALRELLALKPDFAAVAREDYGKWMGPGPLVDHMLDGLRNGGFGRAGGDRLGNAPGRGRSSLRLLQARRAPTRASGSRCCRSSTPAPTPTSPPWPRDCPRRS